jgi:hypothetical protein
MLHGVSSVDNFQKVQTSMTLDFSGITWKFRLSDT